jgi:hypothetical protein
MKWYLHDMRTGNATPSMSFETGLRFDVKSLENEKSNSSDAAEANCRDEYKRMMKRFLEYFEAEEVHLDDLELGLWRSRLVDVISK